MSEVKEYNGELKDIIIPIPKQHHRNDSEIKDT